MRTASESRRTAFRGRRIRGSRQAGFSLIELLIGMSVMAVALLSIVAMFSTGYRDVTAGGKATMAGAVAQQIMEDLHVVPFDRLDSLNGFNSNNATIPAAAVAGDTVAVALEKTNVRNLARKWRYVLAGAGGGWETYSDTQQTPTLAASGVNFGGTATIVVANMNVAMTLKQITVTVTIPGRPAAQMITQISRL